MRRSKWIAALAVIALVGATVAPQIAEAQTPRQKFNRGAAGILTGFLEVPGSIKEEAAASNPVQAMTVGLVKGVFRAVRREIVGVYELVTFPLAVPNDYERIVEPEYPWNYFN